jgi:hypothetical protein
VEPGQPGRTEQFGLPEFPGIQLQNCTHRADRPAELPRIRFVREMYLDSVGRPVQLHPQIVSSLSNEFRRLREKGLQLFLPGRVAREGYSQLQVRMVGRAIRVTATEMLQCIQPVCLSLPGGIGAMRVK